MSNSVRMAMIGCGGMARHHIRSILENSDATEIVALCEPSESALIKTKEVIVETGKSVPQNISNLEVLIDQVHPDAVFIATPHVMHFEQAKMCLEAGIDVLIEKPMVMNAREARDLIEVRDRTGRLLVVAFNGSLSPRIRRAVQMIRSGEIGELLSISATIWQGWADGTADTWRQNVAISGGGFLFDTGAHMMNTVADLAGEEFEEVAAWCDNSNKPVDILAVAIARLASGRYVTLHGCGETIRTCKSEIMVFCKGGIIRTGAWGENLEIQLDGESEFSDIEVPGPSEVWEQFLDVRSGKIENPSPPEVGLRMARLYDTIRASAAQGGRPVRCD